MKNLLLLFVVFSLTLVSCHNDYKTLQYWGASVVSDIYSLDDGTYAKVFINNQPINGKLYEAPEIVPAVSLGKKVHVYRNDLDGNLLLSPKHLTVEQQKAATKHLHVFLDNGFIASCIVAVVGILLLCYWSALVRYFRRFRKILSV